MNNLLQKLQLGGSTIALVAVASFAAGSARAQSVAPESIETVTVTGTSIRGVAPVGSNLMVMSPADIQQTGATDMQGVLAQDPALMAFSNGTQGQSAGAFTSVYQPAIHSLGSSGANTTMVLVDGHRFATSGTNHDEPDPNLIPLNMVQRIEVLAEGASSVYGSDAIAGVVNIITRTRFDGIELSAQATAYPDKLDEQAGILVGKTYDTGWFEFGYEHVHQSQLLAVDRPWTSAPAVEARGGNTAFNFNCDPATLQPAGFNNIFTSATSGVNVANISANGICSQWQYGALIPETTRDNAMIKMEQDFGSRVTLTGDLNVSSHVGEEVAARGTFTATAFSAGPAANPFYQTPVGYTGAATKETIKWNSDTLLGPGASAGDSDVNIFGDMNWEYRPDDNWAIDFLSLLARDDSKGYNKDGLNSSAAALGLNGTISNGGALVPIANTTVVPAQVTLTTSNALDVWDPASSNQTSSAVLAGIHDNYSGRDYVMEDEQLRLQANGTVFDLPAGPVKIAVGAETNRWVLNEAGDQTNGSGPASIASTYQTYTLPRNIYSGFVEAIFPVISPDAGIPMVQKLSVDFSARYDHYSDFGETANPKGSFDWQVYDDLKLRGNYSTSFVAPSIDEIGTQPQGLTVLNTYGAVGGPGNVNLPVSTFPTLTAMNIAGCPSAAGTCNISGLTGLTVTTGDPTMKPDKGRTWSIGGDFTPSFLPGFSASATLWWVHLKGAVQSSNLSFVASNPSLAFLLQLFPAPGATAAQIAASTKGILGTAAASPGISYIFLSKNSDWVNLEEQGVDFNIGYSYPTDDYGTFRISDAASIIMNAHQGFGLQAVVPPGQDVTITNTTGTNGTYSTIANQQRFTLGWAIDQFDASISANYTGSFHNWGSGALNALKLNTTGNVIGGGDIVKAQEIYDMHVSYDFDIGSFASEQLSVTVTNLFNNKPPFENTSTGVDSRNGSLLERGIAVGLTTKF